MTLSFNQPRLGLRRARFRARDPIEMLGICGAYKIIEHVGRAGEGGRQRLPVFAGNIETIEPVEPHKPIPGTRQQLLPSFMRRNLAIGCRCLNDDYPGSIVAKIRAEKNVAFRAFYINLEEIDVRSNMRMAYIRQGNDRYLCLIDRPASRTVTRCYRRVESGYVLVVLHNKQRSPARR